MADGSTTTGVVSGWNPLPRLTVENAFKARYAVLFGPNVSYVQAIYCM
jgi:hypothetical protein